MVVLEHGNTYKKVKCEQCKAIIGFNKKDLHYFQDRNPFDLDMWSKKEVIICPECGNRILIKLIIDNKIAEEAQYEK